MKVFGVWVLLFNIFAAALNYWVWNNAGESLNLLCFGVSTGVSIMLLCSILSD